MGYSAAARPCLGECCVNGGWDCCYGMSVHTSRGSCSSWENHTEGTVGLLEGGDAEDSVKSHSGVLTVARENRKGRKPWTGLDGRTGVEEEWAWEGKGVRKHWERGKRRTRQDIRLDIALQMKGWTGGQNKGKGTHRAPGGS